MNNPRTILLIHPPFFRLLSDRSSFDRYPLALGYLAGAISTNTGWIVRTYNADFSADRIGGAAGSCRYRAGEGFNRYLRLLDDREAAIWAEVKKVIASCAPTVVGISAMSQNFRSACVVARIAKEVDRAVTVVVGGPHASCVGDKILDCPDIDIAVTGEGERTIVGILDKMDGNGDLAAIDGMVYRSGGTSRTTPARKPIEELDTLVFPSSTIKWTLIDHGKYPPQAFGAIMAGRGCPFACTFCGSHTIWGRRVRLRSPGNVVRELDELRKSGLKTVHFNDETFGYDTAWLEELCGRIGKECRGMNWICEMNVSLVNDRIVRMMKKSGCSMIFLGVESGDDEMLRAMNKGISVRQALEACRIVRRHGIELQVYIIAGYPGETEASLQKTEKVLRKIDGDVCFNIFHPVPGTAVYERCRNEGLIDSSYDVSLRNFQGPDGACTAIPFERFRCTIDRLLTLIDRKHAWNRIRRIFSRNLFRRILKSDFLHSVEKGMRNFITNYN